MTTQAEREAQPIAAFAMRSGEDITPPGYLKEGDQGQDEAGNYTITELAFKGYVKVWDNRTGVMSYQPRWLLWQTFQMKRPDGSFMFTDKDPGIPQNYGLDLVCQLNPESPDFPRLQAMGFKPCLKKHTPTKIALDRHMQKKHKDAYAALEVHRTKTEREEDRALQLEAIRSNQELMRAMMTRENPVMGKAQPAVVDTPEAPLYVSDEPKVKVDRRTKAARASRQS